MCIYQGHVYIFTLNMKFLCLAMWLGGLYIDNNTDSDTHSLQMAYVHESLGHHITMADQTVGAVCLHLREHAPTVRVKESSHADWLILIFNMA